MDAKVYQFLDGRNLCKIAVQKIGKFALQSFAQIFRLFDSTQRSLPTVALLHSDISVLWHGFFFVNAFSRSSSPWAVWPSGMVVSKTLISRPALRDSILNSAHFCWTLTKRFDWQSTLTSSQGNCSEAQKPLFSMLFSVSCNTTSN